MRLSENKSLWSQLYSLFSLGSVMKNQRWIGAPPLASDRQVAISSPRRSRRASSMSALEACRLKTSILISVFVMPFGATTSRDLANASDEKLTAFVELEAEISRAQSLTVSLNQ